MKIGQSILVRDLDSEGVELMAPADSTLVSIRRPRLVIVLDEDEDEEGAEGAEGVEGAEGAEGEEATDAAE